MFKVFEDRWPEEGELIVGRVSKVEGFGVFVDLEEYGDKKGLIHISEIASGWIKHIRDHVRENQRIVCKVLEVNPKRGRIELSLKDVNDHQRRERIQIWKNEQKSIKWLERIAEKLGDEKDEALNDVGMKLYDHFSGIYYGFEDALDRGERAFEDLDLDERYVKEIVDVARANIKIPSVKISGFVTLSCPGTGGVEIIKKALKGARGVTRRKDVTLEILYIGSPRYEIVVEAPSYKDAEKILKKSADKAIGYMVKNDGEGAFTRS